MFIIFSFFLSLFLNAHFSDGISPSTRGIGVFFGPDVTQSFLGNHESVKRFDSFLSELRRIYGHTHAGRQIRTFQFSMCERFAKTQAHPEHFGIEAQSLYFAFNAAFWQFKCF